MKIGYLLGYSFSEKTKSHIKENLGIVSNVSYIAYDSLINLVGDLRSKKIQYFILPSRLTFTNDISPVCLDLILRSYGDGINEIFSGVDRSKIYIPIEINGYKNKEKTLCFGNKYYISSSKISNVEESKRNFLEYKVFKLNDFKTKFIDKVLIFLFARKKSLKVLDIVSTVISFSAIATLVFAYFGSDPINQLGMKIAAAVVLLLQLILKLFNFEKKVQKSLIKGHWLYYSFEDTYELGNYVPKGFTTRLLLIDELEGELSLKCGFAGSDTLFWESSNFHYEFSSTSNIAKGFYSYNANILNAKGRRPEGTCMFKGKLEGNEKIKYMDGWFSGRGTIINGRVKYIRVSENDHNLIKRSFPERSTSFENSVVVVGIFGEPGSNTDYAFDEYYKNSFSVFEKNRVLKKYYNSFEDIYCDLKGGLINMTLIPVINKNCQIEAKMFGSQQILKDVFSADFNIVEKSEKKIKIDYVICGREPNMNNSSKTIFCTNVEAAKQCSEFLKNKKVNLFSSTSEAAISLAIGELAENELVICNRKAKDLYNLSILKKNNMEISPVNKKEDNLTTFILFKK